MITPLNTYEIICDACGRRETFHAHHQKPPPGWGEYEQITGQLTGEDYYYEPVLIWKHRCPKCMKKELECPTPLKASTSVVS